MLTSQSTKHFHHAIRYHQYGGSEVLQLEKIPIPDIADDELLIEMIATGVNPIDWKLRQGMRSVPLPCIPGVEGSGIIKKIGKAVKGRKIGEPVYGAIDSSYAEYATVHTNRVFPKPSDISFEQAAAVGGGKTAWGALFELAHLKKGQRVLIHGASGGVGIFAVQLAHLAGAYVIATASSKNMATLHSLGADEIVDYHRDDFEKQIQKVDVVLDAVGGVMLQKSYALVRKSGVLLSIVEQPSQENAERFGIRVMWGGTKTVSSMQEVDRHLHSGVIKPMISKIFDSLNQAAVAQDYSQKRSKEIGKIVLKVK